MIKAAFEYRKQKKALRSRLRALYWNNWRNTLLYRDKKHWWQQ